MTVPTKIPSAIPRRSEAPEALNEGSRWRARERRHRTISTLEFRPGRGSRGTEAMPSTHTSLHYHLIFSTKDRVPSIQPNLRARMHAFLGGVIRTHDGVAL